VYTVPKLFYSMGELDRVSSFLRTVIVKERQPSEDKELMFD